MPPESSVVSVAREAHHAPNQQRRRVLNRSYSRTKRDRRKAEHGEVRATFAATQAENELLKAEAFRLKGLRDEAVSVLVSHGLPLPPSWTSAVAAAPLKSHDDDEDDED